MIEYMVEIGGSHEAGVLAGAVEEGGTGTRLGGYSGWARRWWDWLFPDIRNMVSVNTFSRADKVRSRCDRRLIVTVIWTAMRKFSVLQQQRSHNWKIPVVQFQIGDKKMCVKCPSFCQTLSSICQFCDRMLVPQMRPICSMSYLVIMFYLTVPLPWCNKRK